MKKKIQFVECQKMTLGKSPLCRVLGRMALGKEFFKKIKKTHLYRVPGQVALGKEFKKIKKYFAECQIEALGKDFFFKKKPSLPSATPDGTRQRIKKNQFAECQIGGTRQRGDLTPPAQPAHTHRTHARRQTAPAPPPPPPAPPKEERRRGGRRRKTRRRKKKEEAPRPLPAARRGRRADRVRRSAVPLVRRRPAAIDAASR